AEVQQGEIPKSRPRACACVCAGKRAELAPVAPGGLDLVPPPGSRQKPRAGGGGGKIGAALRVQVMPLCNYCRIIGGGRFFWEAGSARGAAPAPHPKRSE